MGKIKGNDGKVLDIILGSTERSKPVVDEGSGLFLSGVSVEVTWVGNLKGSWPVEG